ncbi:hypothetical protein E4U43_006817 [Claviceps pusilla]|uniref:Cation/H+ exchanger transmembrane domain-containing protein n=1 Tax=Claviceps pusilla TaxID=123648 RepID=A0A9P7NFD4_9HYPO|nr:hypothetical protein E4U43_006817 [Claviceps pusilla]
MSKAELLSLPYHEPDITTILKQSSLLILLNVVNFLLNRFLYCGLIVQILVETAIVQLGFLCLLVLVHEGGLSTCPKSLRANVWVSMAVAITGISIPIGLSFLLVRLTNATPLQCFAAGVSLSFTSLGTTFTVLATSGPTKSRLGVVLTTAAMMDDVVGLVLVQVISNLGKEGASITASIVVRPVLVSIGFIVFTPLICAFLVKPPTRRISQARKRLSPGVCDRLIGSERMSLFAHMLILLGYVTGASYVGTSNLFAAYIAGASISCPSANEDPASHSVNEDDESSSGLPSGPQTSRETPSASGLQVYERFFLAAVHRASIAFSIPITKVFFADIVWKGFVYAMLMILAKLACGAKQVFLQRFTLSMGVLRADKTSNPTKTQPAVLHNFPRTRRSAKIQAEASRKKDNGKSVANGDSEQDGHDSAVPATHTSRSLYPASIIGCAMVARGGLGFLISSLAESNNVFSSSLGTNSSSDLFIIVIWAIVLCTILGPVAVGLLVRRVRKLQNNAKREGQSVHRDVLGGWGIS